MNAPDLMVVDEAFSMTIDEAQAAISSAMKGSNLFATTAGDEPVGVLRLNREQISNYYRSKRAHARAQAAKPGKAKKQAKRRAASKAAKHARKAGR